MRLARSAQPITLAILLAPLLAGCREQGRFPLADAQRHVQRLAGEIGVRVTGSPASDAARGYLVDELARSGFDVRIQRTDAVRPESGQTTRVANIIATKAGRRPEAVALVTHYDSPPDSRGAADDALGVAVCLEAGRLLARRRDPQWSLVVVLTDAEELGLMGAAALVKDPVMARIKAYLNFEAVGSAAPVMLFQTGPGNAWLTEAWRASAPFPQGASFSSEIYRRLPNDTDFTILARTGTPGLNFAAIGDGYTYHTLRDVPDRLDPRALVEAGENAIAIVERLDRVDITRRTPGEAVYFSVGGRVAFAWPKDGALPWLAVAAGLLAWIGAIVVAWRLAGPVRLLFSAIWWAAGTALVVLAMVGAVLLLRVPGHVVHPWYAHPWRFFLLLGLAGWLAARAWGHLVGLVPVRLQASGQPAAIWAVTLPVWTAVTIALERFAPAASFLGAVPLVVASSALLAAIAGAGPRVGPRIASAVALAASAAIWLQPSVDLLGFSVPMFGRLGIVVPSAVYPGLLAAAALWLVPPVAAVFHGTRLADRARLGLTVALAAATVAALLWAAASPAYTVDRAQYRSARYVHDVGRLSAVYEVGGSEPLSDVRPSAARLSAWRPVLGPSPDDSPAGALRSAFVYRAAARPARLPLAARGWWQRRGNDLAIEVTVMPGGSLQAVTFMLPRGVRPVESSLAGAVRQNRWRATVVPVPADGLTWAATLAGAGESRLGGIRLLATVAGLPDGAGWQGLPSWIRTDHATWTGRSVFVIPVPFQTDADRTARPGASARVVTTTAAPPDGAPPS